MNRKQNTSRAPQNGNNPLNQAQAKRRKADRQQMMLYRVLAFLIALSVIVIIAIICISCSHNYTSPSDNKSKITLESSTARPDKNADISHYLVGDTIYINFTALALECNMVITGSDSNQTFTVRHESSNETVTFKAESELAVVNGVELQMQSKAILRGSDMWISADFIKNTVSGVTVNYDSETNTLTIKRNELNASTPDNPKYEDIYFTHNITKPSDTVTPPDNKPIQTPTYAFKLDLSKYEKYMNPDETDEYLIIANRKNKLSADFVPKELTKVYKAASNADKYKMTYTAAMAFEALVKEAEANGINIFPVSGYRSYKTQENTFNSYVNKHMSEDKMTYDQAFAYASTYSQIAGASEHQTGLTMDVNHLEASFGSTKEGRWLADNCHKFGFIIRYPEDKEDVTGIDWEPWHIRFVGRSCAFEMKELGLCLEEYLVYLDKD